MQIEWFSFEKERRFPRRNWLAEGFSISPFSLPLEKKVFMPKITPFEGLFGVFADSLPDGWGQLLADRLMRKNGLEPQTVGSVERLTIVGAGMGALTYRPVITMEKSHGEMSLDEIAREWRIFLLWQKNRTKCE